MRVCALATHRITCAYGSVPMCMCMCMCMRMCMRMCMCMRVCALATHRITCADGSVPMCMCMCMRMRALAAYRITCAYGSLYPVPTARAACFISCASFTSTSPNRLIYCLPRPLA